MPTKAKREPRREPSRRSSRRLALGESSTTAWWYPTRRRAKYSFSAGHSKMLPRRSRFQRSRWMTTCFSWDSARNTALTSKKIVTAKLECSDLSLRSKRIFTRELKAVTARYPQRVPLIHQLRTNNESSYPRSYPDQVNPVLQHHHIQKLLDFRHFGLKF